jgi:hypothetical protein
MLQRNRIVNTLLQSTIASGAPQGRSLLRVSEVLRGILSNNPEVTTFSVERILSSIGEDDFEASLMMFSIPAMVPVPRPKGLVTMPTGAIACQMIAGHKQIRLPRFIRRKAISRKALAVAIHAILPVLEAAEKVVRPRWRWVSHSIWRRVTGLFVLLLVVAIAFPLFGFNALHASSIFVISLGMAEKDGLAVMVGVVAGVLSIALVASGVSVRAIRSKVSKWLWKISRKLGLNAFAEFLDRRGHTWLAKVLSFQWSSLILKWDPEARAANRARTAARAAGAPAPGPQAQRGPKESRPQRRAERFRRPPSLSAADASLSNALA